MLIDPALVAQHWGAVVALTAAVIIGKGVSVSLGAFLTGSGMPTSASIGRIAAFARAQLGLSQVVARGLVVAAAAALSAPFCVGVVRLSQKLGVTLARLALPAEKHKRVDFAAAPRRMLVVTFQLAGVLLVGTPLLALTQPFLPGAS